MRGPRGKCAGLVQGSDDPFHQFNMHMNGRADSGSGFKAANGPLVGGFSHPHQPPKLAVCSSKQLDILRPESREKATSIPALGTEPILNFVLMERLMLKLQAKF